MPILYAFDCDGVLVDSELIASQVDSELLTSAGYKISPDEVTQRFAGMTSNDIHDLVEKEIGRKLPANFMQRQKDTLDGRLARDLKIVTGAKEMLDRLEGARCICSNSTTERLALELKKVGLAGSFANIFSAVEVGDKQPKPAPNVYAYAAKTLGVNPREMVVLEDSVFGVRAGKAAGARVIGFTGGAHTWLGHADVLIDAGAETIIHRFADFPATAEALVAWEGME